jgi:predicted O-methyltransferase YrrM
MTKTLQDLLSELEHYGYDNDKSIFERPRRMLNITRDTGEFLSVLVRCMSAQHILEIGTSNGYSTIWLANAARHIGGTVTTIERSDYKIGLARENFRRSGLSNYIQLVYDDASNFLERLSSDSFDFLFLDSERGEYSGWWPHIRRVLRNGGLLVVDNATSHSEEMAPFIYLVKNAEDFTTSLVPVGNGEFLAVKSSQRSRSPVGVTRLFGSLGHVV